MVQSICDWPGNRWVVSNSKFQSAGNTLHPARFDSFLFKQILQSLTIVQMYEKDVRYKACSLHEKSCFHNYLQLYVIMKSISFFFHIMHSADGEATRYCLRVRLVLELGCYMLVIHLSSWICDAPAYVWFGYVIFFLHRLSRSWKLGKATVSVSTKHCFRIVTSFFIMCCKRAERVKCRLFFSREVRTAGVYCPLF